MGRNHQQKPTRSVLTSRLVPFAFAVGLMVQADACSEREYGLDEDEFLCDEASAHIAECCGSVPGLYCTRKYGCTQRDTELRAGDSLCIRDSSCEAIEAAGLCRINNWQLYAPSDADGSTGSVAYLALKALSCF